MMDESKDRAPRQGWTGSGNRMRYKGDLYGFRHSPKFLAPGGTSGFAPLFNLHFSFFAPVPLVFITYNRL
jgi:hypothetical protein